MWRDLSIRDKADFIHKAVREGYNSGFERLYDEGGFMPSEPQPEEPPMGRGNQENYGNYLQWIDLLAQKKSEEWDEPYSFVYIDMLNNNTYDYKAFYDEDPQRAWEYLSSPEGAHFDDVGKTVYHPSFSNESMYSANNYGDMGTGANPRNITGPSWNENDQLIDAEGNVVFDENQYPLGGNMFIGTKETQETSPWEPPKSRKVVSYRTEPEKYMEMAKKTLNTFGVSDETIQSDPAIKEVMTKYVLSNTAKEISKNPQFIQNIVNKSYKTPSEPIQTHPENPTVDYDLLWNNNMNIGNRRKMNRGNMEQLDNYFISKGVPLYQRQALLYTILQESGADSLGAHGNGYYGLVGWSPQRYNAIKDKSLMGQAEYLYNTLYNGNGTSDWNHGGEGTGYNSWTDAQKAFINAQDFNTAMHALTHGYVRPAADVRAYRIENGPKHFDKGGPKKKFNFQPMDTEAQLRGLVNETSVNQADATKTAQSSPAPLSVHKQIEEEKFKRAREAQQLNALSNQEMSDIENRHAVEEWMGKPADERLKDAVNTTAIIAGVPLLGYGMAAAPLFTAGTMAIGTAANEGFDFGVRKLSNNKYETVGDLIENKSHGFIPSYIGNYMNPGDLVTGHKGGIARHLGIAALPLSPLVGTRRAVSDKLNKNMNMVERFLNQRNTANNTYIRSGSDNDNLTFTTLSEERIRQIFNELGAYNSEDGAYLITPDFIETQTGLSGLRNKIYRKNIEKSYKSKDKNASIVNNAFEDEPVLTSEQLQKNKKMPENFIPKDNYTREEIKRIVPKTEFNLEENVSHLAAFNKTPNEMANWVMDQKNRLAVNGIFSENDLSTDSYPIVLRTMLSSYSPNFNIEPTGNMIILNRFGKVKGQAAVNRINTKIRQLNKDRGLNLPEVEVFFNDEGFERYRVPEIFARRMWAKGGKFLK